VLNGRAAAAVRPETRERIEEAATRLRYRPNAIARGLKLASAGALGLLVPSLRNPVYSAIIRGAFDRAWERSFVVLLAEDLGAPSAQQAYERLVEEGRIDGLLIASARPGSPLFDHLASDPIPCVFVNRRHRGSGRNAVMHEEDAGRCVAARWARHAPTTAGHHGPSIAGGGATANARGARRRFSTVRARVTAARWSPPFRGARRDDGNAGAAGRRVPPTGVFASNINQAVGAIAGRPPGRQVDPGQVSLVGYDDDPLCDCLEVPLTAIRMPLSELGRVAVDALIDQVEGAPPRDIVVETPGARRPRVDRSAGGPMIVEAAVMEQPSSPSSSREVELDERDATRCSSGAGIGYLSQRLSYMDGKWPRRCRSSSATRARA
jgi:LacI family transcriptional regulator